MTTNRSLITDHCSADHGSPFTDQVANVLDDFIHGEPKGVAQPQVPLPVDDVDASIVVEQRAKVSLGRLLIPVNSIRIPDRLELILGAGEADNRRIDLFQVLAPALGRIPPPIP